MIFKTATAIAAILIALLIYRAAKSGTFFGGIAYYVLIAFVVSCWSVVAGLKLLGWI
jgi:hypothetical protein